MNWLDWLGISSETEATKIKRYNQAQRVGLSRVALAKEQEFLDQRLDSRSKAYISAVQQRIKYGRSKDQGSQEAHRAKPVLVRSGAGRGSSGGSVEEISRPGGWSFGRVRQQRDTRATQGGMN